MVQLWEVEEETIAGVLPDTGLKDANPKIRFSDKGAGLTVFKGENSTSWKIVVDSSASSPDSAQLPITFISQDQAFEDSSSALYKHDRGSEWITNREGVRVCWLPQELRSPQSSHFHDSIVAMGYWSGKFCWFDFGPPKWSSSN